MFAMPACSPLARVLSLRFAFWFELPVLLFPFWFWFWF
jgi:hypothetical protein